MKVSLLLSSTLIIAALAACSPKQAPQQMPPPKVTVTHPQMMTVTNWDEYPGHIEAVEMVEVRARVHGQIESIHFRDGAEVKAGDLLFVIDPQLYKAELDRAQAERQRAETHLELAKNDFKRAESLRSTKAISEEEFDTRNKAVREAEASLAAARASEAAAKLNLDYTRITAPISGRISRRFVTVGNLVQLQGSGGSATVLTTIVSMDPIYFCFDADEATFLKYRGNAGNGLDQKAGSLRCELSLVNEQNHPHKGHVDFFDNQVNQKTGTIRLRSVFPNPDRSLVPGMSATVRVPAGPPVQALAVPAIAIGSDQGLKLVMVVNKDGVVEPRPVEVDRQHGAMRIVTKGVTPEDRVIVNGLMMARPGVKVQIVDAPPNGTAPAATAQR
ncbi:MAG: efflux RND transporter periplasmic adaptor subunit [Verrucomicrobia bacterium]|nr:efflux RND transporter periplasmic adaptor subunit [Verrucomicrobiota bacterium]